MSILKITRGDVTQKGLIIFDRQSTQDKSYRLFKPNELQQLAIKQENDNKVLIDLSIGQTRYTVYRDELMIDGVLQDIKTIDEISDTLSEVFLDTLVGGGGGTTDLTTPPHMVYKAPGAFRDANSRYIVLNANNTDEHIFDSGELNHVSDDSAGTGQYKEMLSNKNEFTVAFKYLDDVLRKVFKIEKLADPVFNKFSLSMQTGEEVAMGIIKDESQGEDYCFIGDIVGLKPLINVNREEDKITLKGANVVSIHEQGDSLFFRLEKLTQLIESACEALVIETGTSAQIGRQAGAKIKYEQAEERVLIGCEPGTLNTTQLEVNDSTGKINIRPGIQTLLTTVNIETIPKFIDNTEALAAGLIAGDLYKIDPAIPGGAALIAIVF